MPVAPFFRCKAVEQLLRPFEQAYLEVEEGTVCVGAVRIELAVLYSWR